MSNPDPQHSRSGVTQRLLRPAQVIVVSSVMFTFISYWRTAAVVLCDLASTAYYIGGIVETGDRPGRALVHPGGHALQLCRPLGLHRKLLAVRPRRRLSRGQGGDGRLPGQALRLGPDVRLHPDRADQRRLGRPVHHGPASWTCSRTLILSTSSLRKPTGSLSATWGAVVIACAHHAVLLPPEPARHPRIERQGAQDHDRHHDHGGRHAGLVRRDLW